MQLSLPGEFVVTGVSFSACLPYPCLTVSRGYSSTISTQECKPRVDMVDIKLLNLSSISLFFAISIRHIIEAEMMQ